jgi:hypothetical protein
LLGIRGPRTFISGRFRLILSRRLGPLVRLRQRCRRNCSGQVARCVDGGSAADRYGAITFDSSELHSTQSSRRLSMKENPFKALEHLMAWEVRVVGVQGIGKLSTELWSQAS